MHVRQKKTIRRNRCQLVLALLLLSAGLSARANVYATDIKLNSSTNNAAILHATPVQISYILNEPASAGLSLQIFSGATVVWTNGLAGGAAGTAAGSNCVAWGGTNQSGQNVPAGVYQISITAAATGYEAWTNITDDSPNFSVLVPTGIAVNKNTNSPYFGRVFVGNAPPSYDNDAGIYKCNADGSPADEGAFSQSYQWAGGQFSPWKIAIAQDDTVYINDWSQGGLVAAFDETISTNYLTVFDTANYPYPSALLSGNDTNAGCRSDTRTSRYPDTDRTVSWSPAILGAPADLPLAAIRRPIPMRSCVFMIWEAIAGPHHKARSPRSNRLIGPRRSGVSAERRCRWLPGMVALRRDAATGPRLMESFGRGGC